MVERPVRQAHNNKVRWASPLRVLLGSSREETWVPQVVALARSKAVMPRQLFGTLRDSVWLCVRHQKSLIHSEHGVQAHLEHSSTNKYFAGWANSSLGLTRTSFAVSGLAWASR